VAEVAFLPEAALDYQEALSWYESRSLRAAAGFEAVIEVALRQIAQNPHLWMQCDECHRYYSLRRYPFSVIYRVEGDTVLVVALAHSKRSDFF
jgi:plasmid stabilization system protein ParE